MKRILRDLQSRRGRDRTRQSWTGCWAQRNAGRGRAPQAVTATRTRGGRTRYALTHPRGWRRSSRCGFAPAEMFRHILWMKANETIPWELFTTPPLVCDPSIMGDPTFRNLILTRKLWRKTLVRFWKMAADNILTENPHLYKDFAGPTAQIYIFAYFSNPIYFASCGLSSWSRSSKNV